MVNYYDAWPHPVQIYPAPKGFMKLLRNCTCTINIKKQCTTKCVRNRAVIIFALEGGPVVSRSQHHQTRARALVQTFWTVRGNHCVVEFVLLIYYKHPYIMHATAATHNKPQRVEKVVPSAPLRIAAAAAGEMMRRDIRQKLTSSASNVIMSEISLNGVRIRTIRQVFWVRTICIRSPEWTLLVYAQAEI